MIYYSIQTLLTAGIKDIMIVSGRVFVAKKESEEKNEQIYRDGLAHIFPFLNSGKLF